MALRPCLTAGLPFVVTGLAEALAPDGGWGARRPRLGQQVESIDIMWHSLRRSYATAASYALTEYVKARLQLAR